MKWVVIVVGGLVGLIALMALIGALLPREHRATSTIMLRQPRDSVAERTGLESLVDRAGLHGELDAERAEQLTAPRRRGGEDETGCSAQRRRSASAAMTMPRTPTTWTTPTPRWVASRRAA